MGKHNLECATCAVRCRAVCCRLDDDDLARLKALSHVRCVRAGTMIVEQKRKPEFCGVVQHGIIKLVNGCEDGRLQISGVLFPADFFGRLFGTSAYWAEACTDVEICAYPTHDLELLLRASPTLEHHVLQQALDELDAARAWMMVLGRKTAAERIASFLLLFAERNRDHKAFPNTLAQPAEFELPLRRRDIADSLGLRVETVSRQMAHLKDIGVIDIKSCGRRIVLLDPQRLHSTAEQCLDH